MENLRIKKFQNVDEDILVESNPVFTYEIHTHTYYEMTLYEPFEGKISINGKDIEINSITATLISPLDFHEITVRTPSKAKYIKIAFNADIIKDLTADFSVVLADIAEDGFLVSLFREIFTSSKDISYATRLVGCAMHTMLLYGNKIMPTNVTRGKEISVLAVKTMNERFADDISLTSVARQLSIAPQYLSSVFKENMGLTFSRYLTNLRLQCAAGLIRDTDQSITLICFDVGYGDYSHFCRCFKKQYGVSPRTYRKAMK